MKRWTVALASFFVMLGPGALFSYSLFTQPLIASLGWNSIRATCAFLLANVFLAVGSVVGGYLQKWAQPRRIAFIGLNLWAFGQILSTPTIAGRSILWFLFGYGVLGGLGCGMAYIAALSSAIKWFPLKRQGVGTSLVTMGFGLGAFAYAEMFEMRPAYLGARLLATFIVSAAAFFVLGGFALLLDEPYEDDWPHDQAGIQATTREMLRNPQFAIQWTILFLNTVAGIVLISNAIPILSELGNESLVSAAHWFPALTLFIAIGHLVCGRLSDRIGYKRTFYLLFGIQAVIFFALGSMHHPLAIHIAFAIIFFCLGGGLGSMPAYHAAFFGTQHFGLNYGLALTAWGSAGLLGPLFVSTIKDITGSYNTALQPFGIMLLVAIIFPIISEQTPPSPKEPARDPTELTAPQAARRLPVPAVHLHPAEASP